MDEVGSVDLSVIVPAYNEETRLPTMLDECLAFLEARAATYEVRESAEKKSIVDCFIE